jgi:hypothetical protein
VARRPKPKTSKKVIYSDQWGEVVELTRFRDQRPGKKGRFVSAKSAARIKRYPPEREVRQYRAVRRGKMWVRMGEPIERRERHTFMKTTYPGSVADYEGNIYDSLRQTNILTRVGRASRFLVNIRGRTEAGEEVRLQTDIRTFGDHNQSEQLVIAIQRFLASQGFRTQYNIDLVQFKWTSRAHARRLTPLVGTQFTVTLFN